MNKTLPLLFWLLTPLAGAGADLTEIRTNYFTIHGNSHRAILNSLDYSRPWKNTTDDRDALTRWDIRWSFRFRTSPSGCSLEHFRVETRINITLPRWNTAPDAPEELKADWQRYAKALAEHENGHRRIALAAAAAVRQAVQAVPSNPNCQAFQTAVTQAAQAAMDKHRHKDAEYDRLTRHGATQGARFPGPIANSR